MSYAKTRIGRRKLEDRPYAQNVNIQYTDDDNAAWNQQLPTQAVDRETGELLFLPSLTNQSFAKDADVNTIMEKYKATGMLRQISPDAVEFGDFTNSESFHEQFEKFQRAEDAFMELPAEIRARMENDPGKFIDFLNDPANRDEAVELGLFESTRPVEPETEPAVTPEPEDPPPGE